MLRMMAVPLRRPASHACSPLPLLHASCAGIARVAGEMVVWMGVCIVVREMGPVVGALDATNVW
eukprot:12055988-Prorocentrum_lima.AAC.1